MKYTDLTSQVGEEGRGWGECLELHFLFLRGGGVGIRGFGRVEVEAQEEILLSKK